MMDAACSWDASGMRCGAIWRICPAATCWLTAIFQYLQDAAGGNELLYEQVGFRLAGAVAGFGVIDTLEQLHPQLGDRGGPARTLASDSDVSIVCQGSGGYPMRIAFEGAARAAVIDPFQDFGL
jgi:hypothetical protein